MPLDIGRDVSFCFELPYMVIYKDVGPRHYITKFRVLEDVNIKLCLCRYHIIQLNQSRMAKIENGLTRKP